MNRNTSDWRAAGACITADPDLFFPISGGAPSASEEAKALRICARCVVRQQCLDFAIGCVSLTASGAARRPGTGYAPVARGHATA